MLRCRRSSAIRRMVTAGTMNNAMTPKLENNGWITHSLTES
jgi:hypothetical protein